MPHLRSRPYRLLRRWGHLCQPRYQMPHAVQHHDITLRWHQPPWYLAGLCKSTSCIRCETVTCFSVLFFSVYFISLSKVTSPCSCCLYAFPRSQPDLEPHCPKEAARRRPRSLAFPLHTSSRNSNYWAQFFICQQFLGQCQALSSSSHIACP